jgi:hypothetical protein
MRRALRLSVGGGGGLCLLSWRIRWSGFGCGLCRGICRIGRWLWLSVGHAYEFDIEDEVGFGGNDRRTPISPVGELIGYEETAFAADVHAFESCVPADNDFLNSVGKGDGFSAGMVVGGVKLGAIGEPAGVADGVPLLRLREGAFADDSVDVFQRVESFGDSRDSWDFGDRDRRRGMMARGCALVGRGPGCGLGCRGYGGQQDEREQHRLHYWDLCFWKRLGERDGWIV